MSAAFPRHAARPTWSGCSGSHCSPSRPRGAGAGASARPAVVERRRLRRRRASCSPWPRGASRRRQSRSRRRRRHSRGFSCCCSAIGWLLCPVAAVLVYQRDRTADARTSGLAGLLALAAGGGRCGSRRASPRRSGRGARDRRRGRGAVAGRPGRVRLAAHRAAGRGARRRRRGRARRHPAARATSTSSTPAGSSCRAFTPCRPRIGLQLFGINLLGLRATSAALGIGSVLLLFADRRAVCGDFEVALLAGTAARRAALLHPPEPRRVSLRRHAVREPAGGLALPAPLAGPPPRRRRVVRHRARPRHPDLLRIAPGTGTARASPGWCWTARHAAARAARAASAALAIIVIVAAGGGGADVRLLRARLGGVLEAHARHQRVQRRASARTSTFGVPHRQPRHRSSLIQAARRRQPVQRPRPTTRCSTGSTGRCSSRLSAALFVLGVALVLARHARSAARSWRCSGRLLPLIAGAALHHRHALLSAHQRPGAVRGAAWSRWRSQTVVNAVRAAVPTRIGALRLAAALTAAAAGADRRRQPAHLLRRLRARATATRRASRSPPGCARTAPGKTTYMVGSAPGFYIRHGAIAFLTYGYRDARHRRSRPLPAARSVRPARPACSSSCRTARTSSRSSSRRSGRSTCRRTADRDGASLFLTAIPRGDRHRPARPAPTASTSPRQPEPGHARRSATSCEVNRVRRALAARGAAARCWSPWR